MVNFLLISWKHKNLYNSRKEVTPVKDYNSSKPVAHIHNFTIKMTNENMTKETQDVFMKHYKEIIKSLH